MNRERLCYGECNLDISFDAANSSYHLRLSVSCCRLSHDRPHGLKESFDFETKPENVSNDA